MDQNPAPKVRVWDIVVRVTHWSVAVLVVAELSILDEDWAVHRWAGYAVLGLVGLRLIWGLIGSRNARFSSFPASLSAVGRHLTGLWHRGQPPALSHNPLGAMMVYNLWASLVATCLTGILLSVPGLGALAGLHEVVANWVAISIGLHLAGVAFETWHSKVNLTRAMITGVKHFPPKGTGK